MREFWRTSRDSLRSAPGWWSWSMNQTQRQVSSSGFKLCFVNKHIWWLGSRTTAPVFWNTTLLPRSEWLVLGTSHDQQYKHCNGYPSVGHRISMCVALQWIPNSDGRVTTFLLMNSHTLKAVQKWPFTPATCTN